MANIRLRWGLPLVASDQLPILHTRIDFRFAAGLPWTIQDTILPGATQELLFMDVADGSHFYRATIIDTAGVPGTPVETAATILPPVDPPPGGSPPGSVIGFTATVE